MDWKDLIKYSSVQLRKHDDHDVPCGFGSGCLLDLKGGRFLLTVFHVAKKSSKWSAQVKFDDELQKIEVLFLNEFSYLADFSGDKKNDKRCRILFPSCSPRFQELLSQ
jgi:hypothetical protein